MEFKFDYDDVLIVPAVSDKPLTRGKIDIEIDIGETKVVPLVIANMLSTGTFKIAKMMTEEHILTFLHKEYSASEYKIGLSDMSTLSYVGITSGVQPWDIEKTLEVVREYPVGFINVDIANVYANVQGMVDVISLYRKEFPNVTIVAGNVCTPSIIPTLVEAGADYIKVGVGAGAACKTRSEVGVGVPQWSAVVDCAKIATRVGAKIIADGGCVTSGDVSKAIAAGAELVMVGSMVSKSTECDNIIENDGKLYVNLWGLGSNRQYSEYSPTDAEYRPNEGRDLMIPCEGSILDVTNQIKGALRSTCTYVGANSVSEMSKCATFIRVNNTINNSMRQYERK